MVRTAPLSLKERLGYNFFGDPSDWMEALLSVSTPDEKALTKAGLVAWMFFPREKPKGLIKAALRLRAAALLEARYRETRKKIEDPWKAARQMLDARQNHWLLREFLVHLGGLRAEAEARSSESWRTSDIKDSAERFVKLLPVLKVLHVHCEAVSASGDTKLPPPSLSKALRVVKACRALLPNTAERASTQQHGAVILAERALKKHWAEFQPSLPFLYAAYLSEVKGKGNFLEFMSTRSFGVQIENDVLRDVLSRARFIHELIFARLPNAKAVWDLSFPSSLESSPVCPPADYRELAPNILSA